MSYHVNSFVFCFSQLKADLYTNLAQGVGARLYIVLITSDKMQGNQLILTREVYTAIISFPQIIFPTYSSATETATWVTSSKATEHTSSIAIF